MDDLDDLDDIERFRKGDALPARAPATEIRRVKHKGGAVNWFLRRHAPPPPTAVDFLTGRPTLKDGALGLAAAAIQRNLEARAIENPLPLEPSVSTLASEPPVRPPAGPAPAGRGGCRPKSAISGRRPVTPGTHGRLRQRTIPEGEGSANRQFLHQALLAIGAEVDEARTRDDYDAGMGAGSLVMPAVAPSMQQRECLRRDFARHTDNEFLTLQQRVAEREALVASLKTQLKELHERLEATRAATERRRLRTSRKAILGRPGTIAGLDAFLQANKLDRQRSLKGEDDAYVVDDAELDVTAKLDAVFEEFTHLAGAHKSRESQLQASLGEWQSKFKQQTLSRKITETSLFAASAEVVQLRGEAVRLEQRVHRLGRELRRVYKKIPEVMEHQLQVGAAKRAAASEVWLKELSRAHKAEAFKYLDKADLTEMTTRFYMEAEEMDEAAELAEHAVAEVMRRHEESNAKARSLQDDLNTLMRAWQTVGQHWDTSLRGIDRETTAAAVQEALTYISKGRLCLATMTEILADGPDESKLGFMKRPPAVAAADGQRSRLSSARKGRQQRPKSGDTTGSACKDADVSPRSRLTPMLPSVTPTPPPCRAHSSTPDSAVKGHFLQSRANSATPTDMYR
eukprot:TRINITY_DN122736_c0_g1_i1.p1 TRINITY_DN122736_c0_g1~~TRINITY_DN122736_c0_g1_i1.p1  ORF type:complete len:627 (-),score=157.79 TRINITY_DN122736_c0_g1_i1:83-1963(-)